MWRPGKLRFLIGVKNPLLSGRPRPPENTAPCGAAPVARFATSVGLPPPFVGIRRQFLILIDARFSSRLSRSNRSPISRGEHDSRPLDMLSRPIAVGDNRRQPLALGSLDNHPYCLNHDPNPSHALSIAHSSAIVNLLNASEH